MHGPAGCHMGSFAELCAAGSLGPVGEPGWAAAKEDNEGTQPAAEASQPAAVNGDRFGPLYLSRLFLETNI